MSEHHEEDPQQQQYNQFVEIQQAMNESVSHELHLWLEQQDDEALDKIGSLLWAGMNFQGWGAQMLGILQYMRKTKFGRCVVCAKNHDQEQEEAISAEHAKMVAEGASIPGSPFKMGDADAISDLVGDLIGRPFPEYIRLCHEYNVTSNVDQDGRVFCKNCNMPYPNLDDRMIHPKDHCSGCFEFQGKGIKHPEPGKQ